MKQILFTALLCALFSFSQNVYCQDQIILTNCPDFDTIEVCMNTRLDANVGEFALIDIYVNIPPEIQNNNWRVQFATTTSVFIEHWNFRNSQRAGYTHEFSHVLPINENQNTYVFAVYLLDDVSGFRAYGKQMTFGLCGSNSSQKLSANVDKNFHINKSTDGSNFEPSRLMNEQNFNNFQVFPNPFKENFNIQYEATQNEDVVLEIYDISGNLLYKTMFQHMNSGIYNQGIENLAFEKGAYICKVQTSKNQNTIKLLKTH